MPEPVFKTWKIEKLSDIAAVDAWQMDKCLYFLKQLIRHCRIKKAVLLWFIYHERGKIQYCIQNEDGSVVIEPPQPEEDPLS